ncbi:MAG TPA: hypothetical protein VF385_01610 [Patescibacteria group bacterium]
MKLNQSKLVINKTKIFYKEFSPTLNGYPIVGMQSPQTRSLNVGYIEKNKNKSTFIPCRLNLGGFREQMTQEATIQSFLLPYISKIISKYDSNKISTITILREALACHLSITLFQAGINSHFGDCFVGANHIKKANSITTSYKYENKEGLNKEGLWIISDSIAAGRNLTATLKSLLSQYQPNELLFIIPIGNRWGINKISQLVAKHKVKSTFLVWGALFGLNPVNRYDEPWGLSDCEPIDVRDQKTFVDMYGPNLCVGGDFGNDFYCVSSALKLYEDQLKGLKILPKIPKEKDLLKIYNQSEFAVKNSS